LYRGRGKQIIWRAEEPSTGEGYRREGGEGGRTIFNKRGT